MAAFEHFIKNQHFLGIVSWAKSSALSGAKSSAVSEHYRGAVEGENQFMIYVISTTSQELGCYLNIGDINEINDVMQDISSQHSKDGAKNMCAHSTGHLSVCFEFVITDFVFTIVTYINFTLYCKLVL